MRTAGLYIAIAATWALAAVACSFRPGGAGALTEAGVGGEAGTTHDGPIALDARADARVDAPPDALDTCKAAACNGAGGVCVSGTCVIVVTGQNKVTCPAGETCSIQCAAMNACQHQIDCSKATSCTIDCIASNTCMNGGIDCTGGGCTLYCRASSTCDNVNVACDNKTCNAQCCSISGGDCMNLNIQNAAVQIIANPGSCPP